MTRTCETCKHQGKNRPFCHDCWKDERHPYWKYKPVFVSGLVKYGGLQ